MTGPSPRRHRIALLNQKRGLMGPLTQTLFEDFRGSVLHTDIFAIDVQYFLDEDKTVGFCVELPRCAFLRNMWRYFAPWSFIRPSIATPFAIDVISKSYNGEINYNKNFLALAVTFTALPIFGRRHPVDFESNPSIGDKKSELSSLGEALVRDQEFFGGGFPIPSLLG